MRTQSEGPARRDRYWIDLRPSNTMAEECARITRLIRDGGYELREVVFVDRGGRVHATCHLVKSTP